MFQRLLRTKRKHAKNDKFPDRARISRRSIRFFCRSSCSPMIIELKLAEQEINYGHDHPGTGPRRAEQCLENPPDEAEESRLESEMCPHEPGNFPNKLINTSSQKRLCYSQTIDSTEKKVTTWNVGNFL